MGRQKGKSGAPAKQATSTSNSASETKSSSGRRGASKFPGGGMTQMQKVLLVNGGMGHRLRKQVKSLPPRKIDRKARDNQAA